MDRAGQAMVADNEGPAPARLVPEVPVLLKTPFEVLGRSVDLGDHLVAITVTFCHRCPHCRRHRRSHAEAIRAQSPWISTERPSTGPGGRREETRQRSLSPTGPCPVPEWAPSELLAARHCWSNRRRRPPPGEHTKDRAQLVRLPHPRPSAYTSFRPRA